MTVAVLRSGDYRKNLCFTWKVGRKRGTTTMPIEELKFETDAPVTVIVKEQPKNYPGQWGDRWRYYCNVPALRSDRVFFCDEKLHAILETHNGNEPITICRRTGKQGNRRTLNWEVIAETPQHQQHPPQANTYEDQQRAVAAAVMHRQQQQRPAAAPDARANDRWHAAAEQAIEILMHAQSYAHQEFGLDLHVNTGDVRALMAQILIEQRDNTGSERRAA